jgi:glycine/D-amino acid oxidase-like deaminating enzyme
VVFATGYETEQRLRQPSVKLRSTYALASEPLGAGRPWYERALIWETTRPYLYLRTTDDGRVIVGGEDDSFASPARRDRALPKKTARLIARFAALFPDIPIETAFAWAGTFAETADGLPFIGAHRDYPNAWFAACYGGNGVPFGAVAGELIRDLWLGRANSRSTLFRFGR